MRPRFVPAAVVAALTAVALVGTAPAARAQVTTYDSFSTFVTNVSSGVLADFDDITLGDFGSTATPVSGGGFVFTIGTDGQGNLFGVAGNPATPDRAFATSLFDAPLVFDFASSPTPITAFGGSFFLTNLTEEPLPGGVSVIVRTLSGQQFNTSFTYVTAPTDYAGARFFGVTSTAGPLDFVAVFPTQNGSGFITANDVVAGVATPEPGSFALAAGGALPLLGAAVARRRRARRTA